MTVAIVLMKCLLHIACEHLPPFSPRFYDDAMNARLLEQLADQLLAGQVSVPDFVGKVQGLGIADVGPAQVDLDRHRRCGFPEVVFAQGKTVDAIARIFHAQLEHGVDVLATRMSSEQAAELLSHFPAGQYNPIGRTFRIARPAHGEEPESAVGRVTIVTAGTSDLPVAEEARETALWTGALIKYVQDVGVAGPHRLAANLHLLSDADAIVVVAGMEGALPSVVGGYVSCPVIGVPTSVGYGAAFGGLAALLGMLNSCASNVTVVNIDAGFKGGYVAGMIAKNAARGRDGRREPANG
jgi:pyridinium-3,5-biscarboxylic acid mononucleotide synthase